MGFWKYASLLGLCQKHGQQMWKMLMMKRVKILSLTWDYSIQNIRTAVGGTSCWCIQFAHLPSWSCTSDAIDSLAGDTTPYLQHTNNARVTFLHITCSWCFYQELLDWTDRLHGSHHRLPRCVCGRCARLLHGGIFTREINTEPDYQICPRNSALLSTNTVLCWINVAWTTLLDITI